MKIEGGVYNLRGFEEMISRLVVGPRCFGRLQSHRKLDHAATKTKFIKKLHHSVLKLHNAVLKLHDIAPKLASIFFRQNILMGDQVSKISPRGIQR